MKTSIPFLSRVVLAAAAALAMQSASAGLLGSTLHLRYDYDNLTTLDTLTVVAGTEVQCTGSGTGNANVCDMLSVPDQSVDIGNTSIFYQFINRSGLPTGFSNVSPNRFNFLDMAPGFDIDSVSLITDMGALDIGDITFTNNSLTLNMAGVFMTGEVNYFRVELHGAPTGELPLPGTAALGLVGLTLLGAARARRRAD